MDLRERKNINQQKTREFLQDTIDDLRNSIARTEILLREDKERLSFLLKDLQNRQPIEYKPKPNEVSNALFNIIDVVETIKANGLSKVKRVHDGTDNEETLGDLVEDLQEFLNNLDNTFGDHTDNNPKVFLDFKCDQFVSVETTLTREEAESMTEDGMDALRVKYQSEAIKLYEEHMSKGDFVWELDFHVQEPDGSETEIKI